jgi:hypothetical protein
VKNLTFKAFEESGEGGIFEVISGEQGNLSVVHESFSFCLFLFFSAQFLVILHGTANQADFLVVSKEFVDGLKHFCSTRGNEPTGIEKNKFHCWIVRVSGVDDFVISRDWARPV